MIMVYRGKHYSSTETLTTTETRISRRSITEIRSEGQSYLPSSEEHSTTLVTDVRPKYEIMPEVRSQEHYATTISTDLQPKFQPVDLTISVPIPPKFLKALKNVTTMEGTKVTFEGVVTGKKLRTVLLKKKKKKFCNNFVTYLLSLNMLMISKKEETGL